MEKPLDNTNNEIYQLNRGFRFQWEEAQQSHVLLYPEGMVKLNASAAAILELLDGKRSVSEVITQLQSQYKDNIDENDIVEFIKVAKAHEWINRK